jgi:hypothetical protein
MIHELILQSVRDVAEKEGISYCLYYVKNIWNQTTYSDEFVADLVVYYSIDVAHEPKALPSSVMAYRLILHVYVRENESPEARWQSVQMAMRLCDNVAKNFLIYDIKDVNSCLCWVGNHYCFFTGLCFTFKDIASLS